MSHIFHVTCLFKIVLLLLLFFSRFICHKQTISGVAYIYSGYDVIKLLSKNGLIQSP